MGGEGPDATGLRVHLLGRVELVRDGTRLDVGGPRSRAVLAALALTPHAPVAVDRLVDAVWSDRPPPSAVASLATYVSRLRVLLGGGAGAALDRTPAGYVLALGTGRRDVDDFRAGIAAGRAALERNDAAAASAALQAALGQWRGGVADGVPRAGLLVPAAVELEEERASALELSLRAELLLGRHAGLVGRLRGLVEADPLREPLRQALVLSLYRCGRQADALQVFEDGRRLLADELGIDPGRSLRELHERVLRQDPALDLTPAAAVRGVDVPLPRAAERAPDVPSAAPAAEEPRPPAGRT